MEFKTVTCPVGKFKVSVIEDDQYIGRCIRNGVEWDGWMRQDLPHIYKPRTCLLDIGANIGWNSLMFSDYGPVHAFEPLFHTVVQQNIDQNHVPVEVHPCALGSENGTSQIYIQTLRENGMCNYGGTTMHPHEHHAREGIEIDVKKLDDIPVGPVSVMKIDVERHELEVLKGAIETIKKYKPAIYIEILDSDQDRPIRDFLGALGYKGYARPEMNYLFICPS